MVDESPLVSFRRLLGQSYNPSPGPGNPWPLYWVQTKSILFSKKTPFLLLFLLIPLIITFAIAKQLPDYVTGDTDGLTGGRAWFQDVSNVLFFPFLLPVMIAVYASSAIGEEVEGKTLPYLFTRPVRRSWILLAKALSFMTASALLGIIALTATYFVAVSFTSNPFDALGDLLGYWAAIGLTIVATGGVFLLVGVLLKRAIIAIVLYTLLWETILLNIPDFPIAIKGFSFVYYERGFINSFLESKAGSLEYQALGGLPSGIEATTFLLVVGILGLLASFLVVSYRDYNV